VTGVFPRTSDLVGKNLELLKELLPGVSRVEILYDAFGTRQLAALKAAARTLALQLQLVEVRSPYDYNAAFKDTTKKNTDAVMVLGSPHSYVARDRIAKLALHNKVPTIGQGTFAQAGGLISYGPDQLATFGRAAYFVDRVLKGASPAGFQSSSLQGICSSSIFRQQKHSALPFPSQLCCARMRSSDDHRSAPYEYHRPRDW
jgi:putative ABC transport system substrate-binding protein